LLKELNLLQRDSRDAGLDQPKVWRNFISWDHIRKMSAEYVPREVKRVCDIFVNAQATFERDAQ
ncbi:MAG TPA: hypothetical protein VM715_21650, partial [Candidatus Acidoferrum sp.]|nr:hypothetical protein [Candidatus Acidoferrum sp.]